MIDWLSQIQCSLARIWLGLTVTVLNISACSLKLVFRANSNTSSSTSSKNQLLNNVSKSVSQSKSILGSVTRSSTYTVLQYTPMKIAVLCYCKCTSPTVWVCPPFTLLLDSLFFRMTTINCTCTRYCKNALVLSTRQRNLKNLSFEGIFQLREKTHWLAYIAFMNSFGRLPLLLLPIYCKSLPARQ